MSKWKDYKIDGEHVRVIYTRLNNTLNDLPFKTNIAEISVAMATLIRASKIEKEN